MCLDEKLTFNSTTNIMGQRRFLNHGLLRKSKSNKEIVAFLFNDFLLLTYPHNKTIGNTQFSFDKHHDVKLRLYRKPIFLDEMTIVTDGFEKRKSVTNFNYESENGKEFGIEMLLDNHTFGSKVMMFEAQSIHDRKLWIQHLNDAVENYKEKAETEKSRKYSGNIVSNSVGPDQKY